MPLFLIHALDKPGALDLRLANRADHLAWAGETADRIRMAGPILADDGETFAGSCFVIEGESLQAVRAWHRDDPYVKAGLFETVRIQPFKWLIGNGRSE